MRAPKTLREIEADPTGPPVRLRDVVAITGFSRNTLFADIQRGALAAWKRDAGNGSPCLIDRSEVLAYLNRQRRSIA